MKNPNISKAALLTVAAASLGLAACNSPAEEAADHRADAIEAEAEATADALDAQADAMPAGPAKEAVENKADAVEATGEAKADAVRP